VTVDAGAMQALRSGKSLLPAGVVAVTGQFARGDTVSVLDRNGTEIARGMIAYSDRDAARIMGKRSADIEALLGFRGRDEMIHRDDLVMMRVDVAAMAQ
jgi:glutamate 5-kinase